MGLITSKHKDGCMLWVWAVICLIKPSNHKALTHPVVTGSERVGETAPTCLKATTTETFIKESGNPGNFLLSSTIFMQFPNDVFLPNPNIDLRFPTFHVTHQLTYWLISGEGEEGNRECVSGLIIHSCRKDLERYYNFIPTAAHVCVNVRVIEKHRETEWERINVHVL